MHYIEIGQDIVDAIKGGAGGASSQSDTEEVVGYINSFAEYFSMMVSYVLDFIYTVADAIKKK